MAAPRSVQDKIMNPLDYLSVRFHFRGTFEFSNDDKNWHYKGGRKGMSTIVRKNLSLAELKKHLADHVSYSDDVMERTELCWKLPVGPNRTGLSLLHDNRAVITMAKYCTDAGVMDIFAKMPVDISPNDESDEDVGARYNVLEQQENSPEQHDYDVEEAPEQQEAEAEPTIDEKGKGPKVDSSSDEDSEDSDFFYAPEEDDSNSSADDDEALAYRLQAKEIKKRVKKKMLGDEEFKSCSVPDEFIVPENSKIEEDGEDSPYFDTEDDVSYSDDSDGEVAAVRTRRTKHRVYDENAEVKEFELGQAFTDSRQFKQALVNYGLKNFHHLLFPKDEHKRVSAKCSWLGCPWSIYGSITSRSPWLLVGRYNNVHTCVPRRNNKLVTSTVIAKKYFRQIRDNPNWKVEKMQEAVLEDLCADASIHQCKRAKKLVMEKLIDSTNGEFSRVFDYHLELVRSNPGSTVVVTLNPDILDRPVFERMYICLDACKKGFLVGCRRVVGLDGCFLKGSVSGQLLCAIGRDANNQMYPIAWATVEIESYDSWYWFLSYLQKDIAISNHGEGWVLISDQQKGLIKAVNEIIPQAEHRMCARHIYANWRKQHRDKIFQKMFWCCAKSSDTTGFNYHRAKLALKTEQGAKDMMNTAPEHWCRAFFKLGSYCDSVENNLCESFNNAIMRARFFPIITSMEIIRKKVMVRIQENRAKSNSWPGTICPNIFKKLKMNITRSAKCQILWNGQDGFEVEENQYRRFTVNLDKMSCSCRYWELSGLPCSHAISAIYTVGKELEDFIAPCYRIDVYNQIYDHVLQPLKGKENWPEATNPRPFPPIRKKMPGRPKTERRREEGEKPKGIKISKKGTKITCSLCGGLGHNKRKCAGNPDGGAKEHASFTKAAKHSKKKQMKQTRQGSSNTPTSTTEMQAPVQASSQPAPEYQASSQPAARSHIHAAYNVSSSQSVTTEQVPKHGRMKWWIYGTEKKSAPSGQDEAE